MSRALEAWCCAGRVPTVHQSQFLVSSGGLGIAQERIFSMYSWEEVKRAVERKEDARLEHSLIESEVTEGYMVHGYYLVQRTRPYMEVLGALLVGLQASLMTLGFNYLLFVWLLHVNFDR
jgi:hypothetical protein